MPKFKRRPLGVNAFQWQPDLPHTVHTDSMNIEYKVWGHGVYELSEGQLYDMGSRYVRPVPNTPVVDTSQGRMCIRTGDWVVECDGERWMLSDEEFQKTFKPA